MRWYVCKEEDIDSLDLATLVLATATVVLVIVTGYYATETHRIRKNASRPNFSLSTDTHTMGGHARGLVLVNSGPVARELRIDIEPPCMHETARMYVPALLANEPIRITSQLEQLPEGKKLRVKLSYTDFVGRRESEELLFDPRQIAAEERVLVIPESREVA